MRKICTKHMGISDEATIIKNEWLLPLIESEIESGTLVGEVQRIDGHDDVPTLVLRKFATRANYERNRRAFDSQYVAPLAKSAAFDERLFLLCPHFKSVIVHGELMHKNVSRYLHDRLLKRRQQAAKSKAIQRSPGLADSPALAMGIVGVSFFCLGSINRVTKNVFIGRRSSQSPTSDRQLLRLERTPLTAKGQYRDKPKSESAAGTTCSVETALLRVRELACLLPGCFVAPSTSLQQFFK